MSPEEKAKELFNKFLLETGNETFAKQCALIAVDEIIAFTMNAFSIFSIDKAQLPIKYLVELKEEIEKL